MEKEKISLTAADIRKRHKLKKLRKRRIAIARTICVVAVVVALFCLMSLTKHGIRNMMNKDVIFVTDMQDTVTDPVANSLNAAGENDLVAIAKKTVPEPLVCYLTFDDGPNETITPKIADILRRYNIKATFFQVGSMIEAYPDVTKRLHNEGHLIGNHSYNHNYSELYASTDSFMNEINLTQNIIKQTIGDQGFNAVRFPGGSHNAGRYAEIKQQCKEVLRSSGYFTCDWNSLNGDTENTSATVQNLIDRTKKTVGTQGQPIILMHDSKTKTAEALPEIIEFLIDSGYTFDTLNNLRTE